MVRRDERLGKGCQRPEMAAQKGFLERAPLTHARLGPARTQETRLEKSSAQGCPGPAAPAPQSRVGRAQSRANPACALDPVTEAQRRTQAHLCAAPHRLEMSLPCVTAGNTSTHSSLTGDPVAGPTVTETGARDIFPAQTSQSSSRRGEGKQLRRSHSGY